MTYAMMQHSGYGYMEYGQRETVAECIAAALDQIRHASYLMCAGSHHTYIIDLETGKGMAYVNMNGFKPTRYKVDLAVYHKRVQYWKGKKK